VILFALCIVASLAQQFTCDYTLQTNDGDVKRAISMGTMSYDWTTAHVLFTSGGTNTLYQFSTSHGYTNTGSISFPPSSMEGDLAFPPGSWISGGYHFTGGVAGLSIEFDNAQVSLPVSCVHGSNTIAGTIVVPMASGPYTTGSGWRPWNSQSSTNPLPWQGSVQAPDLCNGGTMYNHAGATFTATASSSAATSVNVQFHYRVPAAKNSPNTNCNDASDPNSVVASICGASQSSTRSVSPLVPQLNTQTVWDGVSCTQEPWYTAQSAYFSSTTYWNSGSVMTPTVFGSQSGISSITLSGGFPLVATYDEGDSYTFSHCVNTNFDLSTFAIPESCSSGPV